MSSGDDEIDFRAWSIYQDEAGVDRYQQNIRAGRKAGHRTRQPDASRVFFFAPVRETLQRPPDTADIESGFYKRPGEKTWHPTSPGRLCAPPSESYRCHQ